MANLILYILLQHTDIYFPIIYRINQLGLTGPILLYDQSLWAMAEGLGIDFLQWRVWIGIWLSVIAVVVAAFQVFKSGIWI